MRGPFQDYGFLKALEAGKREAFTCQLFEKCLRQDSNFLDIGAHLGQYTLLASQTISSSGTIHAFEPHPRSFSYLKKNVEKNIVDNKHIFLHQQAVMNQRGHADLNIDMIQSDFTSFSTIRNPRHCKKVSVETIKLDRKIAPDVIKIDVEGCEMQVLEGCASAIDSSRSQNKLIHLFIEFNINNNLSTIEFSNVLGKYGFSKLNIIDDDGKKLIPLNKNRNIDRNLKLICQ